MGMVMMAMAGDSRGEVLNVRQLAVLRGVGKVCGDLVELVGRSGVALRLRGLRGALQVRRDLRCDLPIPGRIGLLELLERRHPLREWRKTAAVGGNRGPVDSGSGFGGGQAGFLKRGPENGLQVVAGNAADRTHALYLAGRQPFIKGRKRLERLAGRKDAAPDFRRGGKSVARWGGSAGRPVPSAGREAHDTGRVHLA